MSHRKKKTKSARTTISMVVLRREPGRVRESSDLVAIVHNGDRTVTAQLARRLDVSVEAQLEGIAGWRDEGEEQVVRVPSLGVGLRVEGLVLVDVELRCAHGQHERLVEPALPGDREPPGDVQP